MTSPHCWGLVIWLLGSPRANCVSWTAELGGRQSLGRGFSNCCSKPWESGQTAWQLWGSHVAPTYSWIALPIGEMPTNHLGMKAVTISEQRICPFLSSILRISFFINSSRHTGLNPHERCCLRIGCRAALVILVLICRAVYIFVEQPASSRLFMVPYYTRIQDMCERFGVAFQNSFLPEPQLTSKRTGWHLI